MIEHWKTAVIVVAALGQTLFVVLYATFPWYRSFLGRALFFKAFTLGLLVDMAVVSMIFDWPGEAGTVLIYSLVALGIWVQLAAFVRQKRVHQTENSTVETVNRGEVT
jgi:hypothetical protein